MSDGMGRELAYLSSHATNRYFIPNWGIKWHVVGKRTKNYFLKWTPLFISKYRVKYLNIFSYCNRNTIVAASSMPFNLIAIAM